MEHLRNYLQASKARKDNPPRDASQIGNLLHEVFDKMAEQSASRENKTSYHTGFSSVDEIIGGLEPGELIAIGGLPKSGKTALALHIAIQVAKEQQKAVWIYSLRHSPHQITKRLLSMLTGVPLRSIEDSQLTDREWSTLSTVCAWLKEQDIRIQGLELPIGELCDLLKVSDIPAVLILDDCFSNGLEIESISKLKEFARDSNCCVVVASFYHDIHQYIAGGTDKVFFLYGFEDQDYTNCEVNWNRYGRIGDATLYFDRERLMFLDADRQCSSNED